jgi:homoaconitase/3-isopropylmalate dehydratase large subunit
MGSTFAQKLLARKAGKDSVEAGEIVTVRPDHLLTHDNTAAIISKIAGDLETYGIIDPEMPVIVIDHVVPAANEKTAASHKKIREFVAKCRIKNFYDTGEGICHEVLVAKGHALPGSLIVGSDSHTCTYGAVGAFATGIDRTEAAAIMLTGKTWLKVPQSLRIDLEGKLTRPASAKDLVLTIIGDIGADGANYLSVEFHGDVAPLSMEERLTIANMGVEMGAKNAVFPVDGVTRGFLDVVGAPKDWEALWADPDAQYVRTLLPSPTRSTTLSRWMRWRASRSTNSFWAPARTAAWGTSGLRRESWRANGFTRTPGCWCCQQAVRSCSRPPRTVR